MKTKASAPGKIILFGEHFVVYGVRAVLCAIDKRVTVSAEENNTGLISISTDLGSLELEPNLPISEIEFPLRPFYFLADKFLEDKTKGIKIEVESDIPSGVGLGSSSACCVAGAAAISKLCTEKSTQEILELAIEAEKTIFQNTSGADCTVSAFGGMMTYQKEKGFVNMNTQFDFHLVIANSNLEHSTEEVVAKVKQFKDRNEEKFSELCNNESKLIENVLILLKEKKIQEIGKQISLNQKYLEQIGVSNDKLQEMIKIGDSVSFGSKITGAGGGGCIFSLTDETRLKETLNQFKMNNFDCFSVKIDSKGMILFN